MAVNFLVSIRTNHHAIGLGQRSPSSKVISEHTNTHTRLTQCSTLITKVVGKIYRLLHAGLLCFRLAASVQLWIEPAGPVLEGSTITINCRVTGKHPLDVVRLVRVVDNVAYELTTNELLSETFKSTGRYRMIEYDAEQALVRLQISRKMRAVVCNSANWLEGQMLSDLCNN